VSKVYCFRLNDKNPREAQAKKVIEASVEKGYSLRHVIVDALLFYKNPEMEESKLISVLEQLQDLILAFDKQTLPLQSSDTMLSISFLDAVKHSARSGVKLVGKDNFRD